MPTKRLPSSNDTGGTCPRCGAYSNFDLDRVFGTVYLPKEVSEADAKKRMEMGAKVRFPSHKNSLALERVLALICQRCSQSTLVVERYKWGRNKHEWQVVDHWPRSSVAVPPYLPDKIQPLFIEAASCMQAGAPRGSATMTRTTIDAAIQDCGASGPDTHQRIASMSAKLPQQLIDMAHELRLGGNDATHEFEHNWSLEEAQELLDFLHQLLHHLYEVPLRLKAAQRKTAQRRSSQ